MGKLTGYITSFRGMASSVADLLWPPVCHICGNRPEQEERWLCGHCRSSLPVAAFGERENNPLTLKLAGKISFVGASSWLMYHPRGMIAPLFHDFKYKGYRSLARYLGHEAGEDYNIRSLFDGVDILLPVPIYPLKRLRRGYNQAEEIAMGLSDVVHIPVGRGLKAIRSHRAQTGMNAQQRALNTRNVFTYTPRKDGCPRHVMIVDDVCTTGSTMLAAAEAVAAAEADIKISFFSLATVAGGY